VCGRAAGRCPTATEPLTNGDVGGWFGTTPVLAGRDVKTGDHKYHYTQKLDALTEMNNSAAGFGSRNPN
jgi:hypothetical protein